MKKFNKSKVIIPALAMIALTTAASATGTVAWFAANTTANASGMAMKATAGSNLLIAGDTIANTAKLTEDKFGADLILNETREIKPVSTIDGKNFYYTNNALANGDAASGASFSALEVNVDEENYDKIDTSNYGFLEYVFQLKAVNSATNDQHIDLTALELTYAPTTTAEQTSAEAIHAYRAAFFVEEFTNNAFTKGPAATLNAIYAQSNAAHFTKIENKNQAIKATDGSTGDVPYASSATALATVGAGSTKYYKVVVRAYLEGEDTTCNNAQFLGVTKGWSLNLKVALQDTTSPAVTPVTAITTTVKAVTNP